MRHSLVCGAFRTGRIPAQERNRDLVSDILLDVAIALMEPVFRAALQKATARVMEHPLVEAVIIRIGYGREGKVFTASAGRVGDPNAALESLPSMTPVIRRLGDDMWFYVSIHEEPPGSLALKLGEGSGGQPPVELTELVSRTAVLLRARARFELASQLESGTEFGDILSSLSHDLRTPLACVRANAEILMAQGQSLSQGDRDEALSEIMEECDHIETLVHGLVDGMDTDEPLLKEPVLLTGLLRRILKEPRFASRGHRFVTDIPVEACEVWADATGLERVLRNLLDNAVKYSNPESLVVVRARGEDGAICISIADEGFGLAPEHLHHLFERFYRIHDTSRERIRGTGLGLSIARSVVERHGGKIWAESTVGEGSTFSFRLPSFTEPGEGG